MPEAGPHSQRALTSTMLSLGAAAIVLAACGGADKLAMANAARSESGSWQ